MPLRSTRISARATLPVFTLLAIVTCCGCSEGAKTLTPGSQEVIADNRSPEEIYTESAHILDASKAIELLKLAEEKGVAKANYRIGLYYYYGNNNLAMDKAEAVRWFQKGAEKGDPLSMQALGWAYIEGKGISYDSPKAAFWLRKAEQSGQVSASDALEFVLGGHFTAFRKDGTETTSWDLPQVRENIWRLVHGQKTGYPKESSFIFYKEDEWPRANPEAGLAAETVYYWTDQAWCKYMDMDEGTRQRLFEKALPEHKEAQEVYYNIELSQRTASFDAELAKEKEGLAQEGLDTAARKQIESRIHEIERNKLRAVENYRRFTKEYVGRFKREPKTLEEVCSFRLLDQCLLVEAKWVYKLRDDTKNNYAKLLKNGDPKNEKAMLEKNMVRLEAQIKDMETLHYQLKSHFK